MAGAGVVVPLEAAEKAEEPQLENRHVTARQIDNLLDCHDLAVLGEALETLILQLVPSAPGNSGRQGRADDECQRGAGVQKVGEA